MSAYIVNDKTINVIASGFCDMDLKYRNKENAIKRLGFEIPWGVEE